MARNQPTKTGEVVLVPPHNLEAEESVLGAMVINPNAIAAVTEILTPDDFYRTSHGTVYRAIVSLADRSDEVDPLTLADELAHQGMLQEVGGKAYLHTLAGLPIVAANARRYAEIVREASLRRSLMRGAYEVLDMVGGNAKPTADLLSESLAKFEHLQGNGTGSYLQRLADVDALSVEWLWPRWIPRAMPTVLFGTAGLGKSHVAIDIAAHVTTGSSWPDSGRAPHGNVVILSGEDEWRSVLLPRLRYAEADVSRVFTFPSVDYFGGPQRRLFSIVDDAALLEREIARVHAVLAIIDPVTAFLAGLDSHRTTDVRAALVPVADIAERTGAAFLCIMHPNKNESADAKALNRLAGSGAFGAAPRSVIGVAPDPERQEEGRRLLLSVKLNLAAAPVGLGFHIMAASPDTCDSRIVWDGEPVRASADEAFAGHCKSLPRREAEEFVITALSGGPLPWQDIVDEADEAGIAERTLRRARDELQRQGYIIRGRTGFDSDGSGGKARVLWQLASGGTNGELF